MRLRHLLCATLALVLGEAHAGEKHYGPGITDTTITMGNTMPYSGSLSTYGTIGRAEAAYFRMINEQGGINGRNIEFLSLDDAYSPPRTAEQTRRLVERDEVLLIFSAFGTATISAVQKYLAERRVPTLFFVSGASKWDDPHRFPWMRGWQPTYEAEGRAFAKYLLEHRPNATVAVLYQNDDYGKDYLKGFRDGLGDQSGRMIAKEVTYEATDPTIDSQVVTLQSSGADVFFDVTTGKFAAQAIRKAQDIGWRPLHLLNSISTSVSAVLTPAGLEKAQGIVSLAYVKDPTDPQFRDDPDVAAWAQWMERWFPEGDRSDASNVNGYSRAMTLVDVLERCGDDLTRENVMHQAANIDLDLPLLMPGIKAVSRPDRSFLIQQMQLRRFNGTSWERFGDVIALD
jgi:branched-chain amino acid transport system substrate-binding protein